MRPYWLLAIMLTGCASASDGFRADGVWSHWEVDAVQNALDEWCEKSRGARCAYIDPNAINTIEIADTCPPNSAGCMTLHRHSKLEWMECIRIVPVRSRPDWLEWLRRVSLHEFGHHFGKLDVSEYGQVMTGTVLEGSTHLTEEDIR